MKNTELAIKIVELIGGSKNISQVWNCFTRVRFNVVDEQKVNIIDIEKLEGVLGVRLQNGQVQVIVGNEAARIFEEIEKLHVQQERIEGSKIKGNIITAVLDVLSGVFTPILPAIIAGGMLKALLSLVSVFGWLEPGSSSLFLLEIISDAPFYFLPFLLAVSASKKFKTNEFLGLALAGVLLYPSFVAQAAEGAEPLSLLFLKIPFVTYSTSVIPIILGVYLLSVVYKVIDKVIPQLFKIIVTPLVALLITAPLTLIFLAPIGSYAGVYLAGAIDWLLSVAAPLAGFVATGLMPLIIMTGMHYAFFPSAIQSLGTNGYDLFLLPSNIIANMAQAGAALAVGVKTKDQKIKSLGFSTGVSAIFGITEPAMYGVNIKYKKPFYAAMLSGAISGGFAFFFGMRAFAFAAPGILSIPAYVDPSGAALNLIIAVISVLSSFALAFILTLFFGFSDSQLVTNGHFEVKEEIIKNVVKGRVIPLSEVNDKTFSEGIMGKGVGIVPSDNKVYAPCNGEIVTVFKTKHAITLLSDYGVELLIHVGLETVNLDGEHFISHVKDGQRIKAGDLLLEFNRKAMIDLGYDMTTELVVINSTSFSSIETILSEVEVNHNVDVLVVKQ